ncbi:hypothetical protein ACI2I2_16195 [Scandinavium sp. NPDC088450]|uniref:hypothetical protein n=1 Tax=Scandinavium sp. NPDC088450 TaxID=3364514 RepID=UPI00384DEEFA
MPLGIGLLLLISFSSLGNMRCISIIEKEKTAQPLKIITYKSKKNIDRDDNMEVLWDFFGNDLKQHYRVKYLGKNVSAKKSKLKKGREYECFK